MAQLSAGFVSVEIILFAEFVNLHMHLCMILCRTGGHTNTNKHLACNAPSLCYIEFLHAALSV